MRDESPHPVALSRVPRVLAVLATVLLLSLAGLVASCWPLAGETTGSPEFAGELATPPYADLARTPGLEEFPGELVVYFLDTGQSDATYIRTPGGKVLVIDAGDTSAPDQVADFLIGDKGLDRVDTLVLTHPHADHLGGVVSIFNRLEVGTFCHSGVDYGSDYYAAVLERAVELRNSGQLDVVLGRAGQTLELGDAAVDVRVLHPADPLPDDPGLTNEASVVVKVTYGSFAVLLAGDIGTASESAIRARGADLEATVLKVGHHGSAGSSSTAFLTAVHPEVAVIEVGAGNGYGHPSEEALARLEACGASVFRTDTNGTVIVHSNGVKWGLVSETGG